MATSSSGSAGAGGGLMGTSSASVPTTLHLNESTFNDYHFSSFVAMETPVTVVPRFTMARVMCLGGSFGPFEPNYPVDVPLWLALHLRQTDTCTITPPHFLRVPFLRNVLERERAADGNFEPLPFFFFEICKLICGGGGGGTGARGAADDVPHTAEVLRLVGEIKAVRERKLQQSMGVFEPEGSAMFIPGIRLTHIICSELHFLRTGFGLVLKQAASMEDRRQRPMAGSNYSAALDGGQQQQQRLPHVSTAGLLSATPTPARGSTATTATSAAAAAAGGGGGSVAGRPSTSTVAGSVFADDGTIITSTSQQGGPSQDVAGRLSFSAPSDGGATAAVDGTQQQQGGGPPGVVPPSAAAAAPLAQPPVKKRRTLRQT